MHDTTYELGRLFFKHYIGDKECHVLELGSMDVNGSLRDFANRKVTYVGMDMSPGKSVDVVLEDPYKYPFKNQTFDFVISTSCFEHDKFFWQSFLEMCRVTKEGGFIYINAPSNGVYHAYPVDCWRFYPDSSIALAEWADYNKIDIALIESFVVNRKTQIWNDYVMIFKRDKTKDYEGQFIGDIYGDIYNYRKLSSNILDFEFFPEDLRIIKKLRWNFPEVKERFANLLMGASWLNPFYEIYKYYYRDRPINSPETCIVRPVWKSWYESFRDIVIYIIRSHHYLLTIRTRLASRWRHRTSTAVNTVPFRILKPLSATPVHSVLFVSYHPQGFISDHVKHYVANFKRTGHAVVLIKIVDDMDHPLVNSSLPHVDAVMVRKNAGYDFAAWAHGTQVFPEVYQGKTLWIVNDSMFGPANLHLFDCLLEQVDKSGADLVSLTESYQYAHHYQSYFLVFRNLSRHANEVQKYWNKVRNIKDKRDVIFEYELDLMHHFAKLGFRCCALFPVKGPSLDNNPTFYRWKQLLDAGFPFLKVSLLRPEVTIVDNTTCRESFAQLGYNSRMIDDHFQAMNRTF